MPQDCNTQREAAESGEGVGAPPSRPRRRRRQHHGPRRRCRCPRPARSLAARSLPLANFRVPLQMVSRCKLRCFRAFPRARPLPPARAPRAHTHSRTHARTHALPGEGRAAASTACNRHTINNNRFLRSGLASRSPASAGGGGGGGGRGAGSSGPGAPPGPILGLPQGSRLRLTQPAGHPSGPPSASASLFAVLWGAGTHPPPPPTSRNK